MNYGTKGGATGAWYTRFHANITSRSVNAKGMGNTDKKRWFISSIMARKHQKADIIGLK